MIVKSRDVTIDESKHTHPFREPLGRGVLKVQDRVVHVLCLHQDRYLSFKEIKSEFLIVWEVEVNPNTVRNVLNRGLDKDCGGGVFKSKDKEIRGKKITVYKWKNPNILEKQACALIREYRRYLEHPEKKDKQPQSLF